ncbi:MAG: hypothetical protein F6K14_25455 [Symploca sp. SIO2C1]|nr:hypothetical protein [Symploca sp. SIO2C1]
MQDSSSRVSEKKGGEIGKQRRNNDLGGYFAINPTQNFVHPFEQTAIAASDLLQ